MVVDGLIYSQNKIHALIFQVGRAFSFNKTPSKMKRAVSSMISPITSGMEVMHSVTTPNESMRELRIEVRIMGC